MKNTFTHNGDYFDAFCSTGDAVFIVNENRHIIRWNKAAEVILKYSEPEVLNRKCYQIFLGKTPEDTVHCQPDCRIRRKVEESAQKNFDIKTWTKDGNALWFNVSVISPVLDGRRYIAHILRDISREKKMEFALNRLLGDLCIREQTRDNAGPEKRAGACVPGKVLKAKSDAVNTLSEREKEVLLLVAEGLDTKSLAQKLHISQFTARNHIQNILAKLDLHSKTQAVSYAFKKGLL